MELNKIGLTTYTLDMKKQDTTTKRNRRNGFIVTEKSHSARSITASKIGKTVTYANRHTVVKSVKKSLPVAKEALEYLKNR